MNLLSPRPAVLCLLTALSLLAPLAPSIAHAQWVPWTTVSYNSADFTGSGSMTWGVDSAEQKVTYVVADNTMRVTFSIETSDVGGTAGQSLQIAIPGGYTGYGAVWNAIHVVNAGVSSAGVAVVDYGASVIQLRLINEGNWALTSNDNTYVHGEITFPVSAGGWSVYSYNSSHFTGSGSMTWGVDDADEYVLYTLDNSSMTVAFMINATDVAGTAGQSLQLTIPGSYTGYGAVYAVIQVVNNDTASAGLALVANNTNVIQFRLLNEANWSLTSSDNTYIRGEITFPVSSTQWLVQSYSGGNYSGSGSMTWSVDDADEKNLFGRYFNYGEIWMFSINVNTSDVGGTASQGLRISGPTTASGAGPFFSLVQIVDADVASVGLAVIPQDGTYIEIRRLDGSNWTLTSSDNTYVRGQITYQVPQ